MIKEISNTWLEPKGWSDLTEFRLNAAIEVNGYKIPDGFITDGGSIPWGFRNSFSPTGKGFPAFIAHDHKCKRDDYSRKQADKELYRDLKDCGVNKYRAKAMYRAVRTYAVLTGKK